MGGKKKDVTDVNQTSTSTTTPQATAQETELNALLLNQLKQISGPQIGAQNAAFNIINQILSGQQLTGALAPLTQGIDPEQEVEQALSQVAESAQFSGILSSGTAADLATRTAADIQTEAQRFNIGTLGNLFGTALTGIPSASQPSTAATGFLSSALAGLRPITNVSSGSSTTTVKGPNPFVTSFQQSLGSTLGGRVGKFNPFGGGGGGFGGLISSGAGAGGAPIPPIGGAGFGCWIAAELFGGWYKPKTCSARNFVNNIAPQWFKELYMKYGEKFAKFISNKPIMKFILKPLFEIFAWIGGK